jgi:hypothetical protein
MKRIGIGLCVVAALAVFMVGCGGGGTGSSSARAWILDTSNQIRRVRLDLGIIETSPMPITGLQGGESLLAIDVRAASGQLYGLGSTGRLYTINTATGAATVVGTPVALTGSSFGFDVNTVVDRVRVVSDAEQNFRIDPNTGAIAGTDTSLAYDAADTNSGANPNVVAAAYTNNFAGATQTTLFGLDSNLNVLVRVGSANGTPISPNSGLLFTVAPLGVDITGEAGFDIDNVDAQGYAVVVITGNTESSLGTVDLGTGQFTLIAPLFTGGITRDIAVIP